MLIETVASSHEGDTLVFEARCFSSVVCPVEARLKEQIIQLFEKTIPTEFGTVLSWTSIYVMTTNPELQLVWNEAIEALRIPVDQANVVFKEQIGASTSSLLEVIARLCIDDELPHTEPACGH